MCVNRETPFHTMNLRVSAGPSRGAGRAHRRAFSDTRAEGRWAELSREISSANHAFRLLARSSRPSGTRVDPRHLPPRGGRHRARRPAQRANTSSRRPARDRGLTRDTGETSSVEILAGAMTLILDEVLGGHLIGTSPAAGTRWPAHAASTGKVLLAAAQEPEPGIARRLAQEAGGRLLGLTPATIRSASARAESPGQRQGFSIDQRAGGAYVPSARRTAHDGRIVAAISIGAATRSPPSGSSVVRPSEPPWDLPHRLARRGPAVAVVARTPASTSHPLARPLSLRSPSDAWLGGLMAMLNGGAPPASGPLAKYGPRAQAYRAVASARRR